MTAPELTTQVAFVRAGVPVAHAEVPGHLLELDLPRSVELRRQGDGRAELLESGDPLYECCGELLLPWINRDGPGITVLTVPPPDPFNLADLERMWQARNRMSSLRRPPTSGTAAWSRLEYLLGPNVDWTALEAAVFAASALLSSWPTAGIPTVRWLPLDRPGGRVLVSATERAARSHVPAHPGGNAPAATARRYATAQRRTLHALTAVADLLARRLEVLSALDAEPDIRARLVGLFRRLAHGSHPDSPVADPPPSAWPATMAGTYSACLRALSAARNVGAGSTNAPLSELWELYQSWVADEFVSALTERLGQRWYHGTGTCLGGWQDGDGEIELHYQANVPAYGGALDVLGERFVAAVGELQPDLLLVRRAAAGTTAIAIDAKKRLAPVSADDLTTSASKYLWGVRRASSPNTVPAILGCSLVAPLGGPGSAFPSGRADVITGHPAAPLPIAAVSRLIQLLRGVPSGDVS